MSLVLRNIRVVAPGNVLHGETTDIYIRDGKITGIGPTPPAGNYREFQYEGACLSPGWLDIGVMSGDPGMEHREDFHSLQQAALAGGFTAIALLPNTHPVVDSKSQVQYIKSKTAGSPVDFLPIGAATVDCAGKEMAEMIDMQEAGVIAFSDGYHPIQHSGMMLRCLLYTQGFGGLLLHFPFDKTLTVDGQMHEGEVSTSLGLPGLPSLSEEVMVQRDIQLVAYTGARLHFSSISSAGSVELIRKAKAKGLPVTCSVAVVNIALDDTHLMDFDTYYKVMPPLRSSKDIAALKKGLKDGTIDFITSNHVPLDTEAKDLEFSYADFGIIGLETAFAVASTALENTLNTDQLIQKMAYAPRQLLQLSVPEIEVGADANFTIFHPAEKWTFTKEHIFSKSKNTPFVGSDFKGKVLGVVKGDFSSLT